MCKPVLQCVQVQSHIKPQGSCETTASPPSTAAPTGTHASDSSAQGTIRSSAQGAVRSSAQGVLGPVGVHERRQARLPRELEAHGTAAAGWNWPQLLRSGAGCSWLRALRTQTCLTQTCVQRLLPSYPSRDCSGR